MCDKLRKRTHRCLGKLKNNFNRNKQLKYKINNWNLQIKRIFNYKILCLKPNKG